MSNQAKFQKALKKLAKEFEVEIPEFETTEDLIREAASVIAYFDMRGEFKEEICRNCKRKFAFAYYSSSVKCCSIPCMAAVVEGLGLSWDPQTTSERRWGRYVPAIVPAVVVELVTQIEKEEPTVVKQPAPLSAETLDLISQLDSLF